MSSLNLQAAKTAYALRVFGRGQTILALTDFDQDLEFGGFLHRAVPGTVFGALTRSADLAPDHMSIETALCDGGLTRAALASQVYAEARAELWRVDAENPAEHQLISVGTIGELARNGDRVSMEFRSLTQGLSKPVGRLYQKSCDARLGDARCGVDFGAAAFHKAGTIHSTDGLEVVVAMASVAEATVFDLGTLTFVSGALAGYRQSIRTAAADPQGLRLILWEALPPGYAIGDGAEVLAGCDKQFSTCRSRFQNADNFRGFPHVPGTDVLKVQRPSQ